MQNVATTTKANALEILVINLQSLQFCLRTTSIREIRGWSPVTPLPYTPHEMIGISNLRGMVIPIIDLAVKLGMAPTQATERSAIVVAEVEGAIIGLLVEGVSDIMTVSGDTLQPVPLAAGVSSEYADGIITQGAAMICFLNLEKMFHDVSSSYCSHAA